MRLKPAIFALLFGAFAALGDTAPNAAEAPQATAPSAKAPTAPPAPQQPASNATAKDAVEELLKAVDQTGLLEPITSEHTQELQDILLKLLNVPATLEKEAPFPKAPTVSVIPGTRVVEIAIPQFDDDIALELKKLAQLIDKEKPIALLLNLCKSSGDSELPSQQLLEYCSTESTLIAVLFDKGTKGIAETTVQELAQRKYLAFGEPSAGLPGARKAIPLSNGASLKYYAAKSQPIKPQIDLTQTADHAKWPRTAADHLTITHIQKKTK